MLKFTFIFVLALLSGCATDCNVLSASNSRGCDAQLAAAAIVTVPALLPYAATKQMHQARRARTSEKQLRAEVERGDLAASVQCLYVCPWAYKQLKDDRWRVQSLAAQRVVHEHTNQIDLSPRQEANLFAAHKVLADRLWQDAPAERIDHLHAALRVGQSSAMWSYVGKTTDAGNDLPVNRGYFISAAEDIVIDSLMIEQESRSRATADTGPHELCDLSALSQFIRVAKLPDDNSYCERAIDQWQRRQRASH
jgi:hypothetical protein